MLMPSVVAQLLRGRLKMGCMLTWLKNSCYIGGGLRVLQALLFCVLQKQVHGWRQAVDGELVAIAQLIVAFTEGACGKGRAVRVGLGTH